MDELKATADGFIYLTLDTLKPQTAFYGWFYEPPRMAKIFDPESVNQETGECFEKELQTVFFMSVNPKNTLERKMLASSTIHLLSLVETGISKGLYTFFKDKGELATPIKLVFERMKPTHTGHSMAEWTIYRLGA